MPRLAENIQMPLALYPIVAELDNNRGVLAENASELGFESGKRLKLATLALAYGDRLGPRECAGENFDLVLDLQAEDFENASIPSMESGLYVFPDDPRYFQEGTEQLVRVGNWKGNNRSIPGIVFPSHEFVKVGHSPPGLVERAMAKTRAKKQSEGIQGPEAENEVGRSAGHILERYIGGLTLLDKELETRRKDLYVPLYKDARRWPPHFKPKNLDKKRREFDEEIHDILDTASLNSNIGTVALKAAHRAVVSKLYRRGSSRELNAQWQAHVKFAGDYLNARRGKIKISSELCEKELDAYAPFLAQAAN